MGTTCVVMLQGQNLKYELIYKEWDHPLKTGNCHHNVHKVLLYSLTATRKHSFKDFIKIHNF